jgi:hypothetical protein
VAKANLEKVHKKYEQIPTRGQVSRKGWNVAKHQEFPNIKRFESQVLRPICGPIQSVEKETFRHLQWRTPKSRGETHLRVSQSQVAESWDLVARSRLPTLKRGRGSSWEPRD